CGPVMRRKCFPSSLATAASSCSRAAVASEIARQHRRFKHHIVLERSIPMANFLFVYRGGEEGHANMTPDEIQGIMKKWTDWIGEGFAKGWMVDGGDALTEEGKVVHANKVVTDGPFVE